MKRSIPADGMNGARERRDTSQRRAMLLLGLVVIVGSFTWPTTRIVGASREATSKVLAKRERLQQLVEREEFAQAERLLREIEREAPTLFPKGVYEYARARLRQRMNDLESAARAFHRVLESTTLLSPYAAWHLAEIARERGAWEEERALLLQALKSRPAFWLEERIRWRLAENAWRRGAWEEAIERYQEFAAHSPEFAPVARLNIARAHARRGRMEEARALLLTLSDERSASGRSSAARPIRSEDLLGSPNEVALQAVRELDALDRARQIELTPEEHRRRARLYRMNRAFEEARGHYGQLIARFPDHARVPEALLEIGRSYYAEGEFDRAVEWFERVAERFPHTPEGEQGAYLVGHAHARAGRWSAAIARYEAFIAAYPQSEALAGAHVNLIDALRSAGREEEALLWCQRTRSRFAGRPAAIAALFSEARIRIGRGEFSAALAVLDELLREDLNQTGPQMPDRQEVMYWRGRVLEALGRWDEAISIYLSLPEERGSYYGRRATERLRALWEHPRAKEIVRRHFLRWNARASSALLRRDYLQAKTNFQHALRLAHDEPTRQQLRRQLNVVLARLPVPGYASLLKQAKLALACDASTRPRATMDVQRARAEALLCLGIYDEGAWELAEAWGWEGVIPRASSRRESTARARALDLWQLYRLAVFFERGGYAYEALRLVETHLAPLIPKDHPLDQLPTEVARLLYPVPYRRWLHEHIVRRGLDPALALAMIREESRFRPDAKSPAAARGLAQFIPETARRLAERAGLQSFEDQDAYRPEISLRLLGVWLEEHVRRFSGQLPLILAAYNAGEENALRWLARARSDDPDRFISEIGFRETKMYVQRVLAHYWAYRELIAKPTRRSEREDVVGDR
ncbi:MAG: tetratricopeptide repeat protein [Blastocatellia bacterium]|nr:tetratricopeptide repeat protein [Blastocatellia bacterium]MCS7157839.1 tetratricopeptide repeat protein [Blastocatellia bacterium]MDW8168083.1 tetratricopeptide repeat protein [Acidobacteriota bacterium]MDW8257668.1 tetratricopeptide repeat protein [Acidobacteriota bacterium]